MPTHHPKPGYQPKRHPTADFLIRPANPAETCRFCKRFRGWECKVKDTEGPWLHEGDMAPKDVLRSESYPANRFSCCVYWRCPDGVRTAMENLEAAKAKGALVVKVTREDERIKRVRGADATFIKPGFVDEEGKLYAYKDHDKRSKVVIRTGQSFKA